MDDSDRISVEKSSSAGSDSQNLGEFDDEVQAALEDLLQMDIPDWISPHRGADELYYGDVQAYGPREYVTPILSKLKWFSRKYKTQEAFTLLFKSHIERDADEAKELLNEKSVRQRICPVLTKGANDFWDIAKCITPVLFLKYPVTPLIVALSALMIARIGIDRFCRDNAQITR